MKILGIVGSPRQGGNTDILIEHALKGAAEEGGTVEKIALSKLRIEPCRGCFTCMKTNSCVINDDMPYEKIAESSGIIIGTPDYFANMTGLLKIFLDRWMAFFDENLSSRLKDKNIVGAIIVACHSSGEDELEDIVRLIKVYFDYAKISFAGSLKARGLVEVGDALRNDTLLAQAHALGKELACRIKGERP